MIAELGRAALWLAAAFAVLQVVAGVARGEVGPLAAAAAYAQALLAVAAFAALAWAFQAVDLSVEAVIAADDRRLPPLYRLAAVWADWPGRLLLTLALVALAGAGAALGEASTRALAHLGVAGAVLAGVLLAAFDPFVRAIPAPTAGNGLAAALQVPLLTATTPLAAAGVAALLAALAARDTRFAAGAAALFALSATAHAWAGWHARGALDVPGWTAALWLLALVASRPRWPSLAASVVGAVAVAAVVAAGATTAQRRLDVGAAAALVGHSVRLVALAPVAGVNWTGIEAEVAGAAGILRPQRRDYVVPAESAGRAATAGGLAVTLVAAGATGATVRLESRPSLAWGWFGAACVFVGGVLGAVARRR